MIGFNQGLPVVQRGKGGHKGLMEKQRQQIGWNLWKNTNFPIRTTGQQACIALIGFDNNIPKTRKAWRPDN